MYKPGAEISFNVAVRSHTQKGGNHISNNIMFVLVLNVFQGRMKEINIY